jgi:undecaprenyl-diphosphatase
VAAAFATVAGPYLRRPTGRAAWLAVLLLGFAAMYAGLSLPLDLVGGAALGWAAGALGNLL